jgi:DNA-binding beta-propeller fold protein YncE
MAAGVALSTVGVSAASASSAHPRAPQAARVSLPGGSRAPAGPGAQLWTQLYNGLGNNTDAAKAVAVSPDGKTVYVTGQSYGTSLVYDYATVAYNAATGHRLWAARYNGPAGSLSNVPSALAVSPDGKAVYVTGTTLVGQNEDYATVAYNAATGQQLWARGYNGPLKNADTATAVAVNPASGTVYVTGSSFGINTQTDYATIAYTASGAQLWVKRYNGPPGNGDDNANAVAVSPNGGTVYVTGESDGASSSGFDYATVAYNATSGAQLWVRRYAGPGNNTDNATSVAVSPTSGTVYVTGDSWGGAASADDYATVAYTATGTQLWVKRYNGPGHSYDDATSVAVSPTSGTAYVTGKSWGTNTGYDYATVAYTATGTQLWVKRYNGPGNANDIAYSLAVSPTGNTVYVTGEIVTVAGTQDYATVAYTATGTLQWLAVHNGADYEPNAMAVSPTTGTVIVAGTSPTSSATGNDYLTIAYQG